ncbi:MAG: hypothetical protein M3162_06090 [Thermoproteota archaeon]|nr:hypothetical protein [Thermoproteota archaeon]
MRNIFNIFSLGTQAPLLGLSYGMAFLLVPFLSSSSYSPKQRHLEALLFLLERKTSISLFVVDLSFHHNHHIADLLDDGLNLNQHPPHDRFVSPWVFYFLVAMLPIPSLLFWTFLLF